MVYLYLTVITEIAICATSGQSGTIFNEIIKFKLTMKFYWV